MAFTDQDLEEILMDANDQIEMNGTYEIDGKDFRALLTRLDAAEKALIELKGDSEDTVLFYEWRKASGK